MKSPLTLPDKQTHKPTNRRTTRQTCSKRGWGPPLTDYTCTYVANTVKLTLSLRPDLQRFLPAWLPHISPSHTSLYLTLPHFYLNFTSQNSNKTKHSVPAPDQPSGASLPATCVLAGLVRTCRNQPWQALTTHSLGGPVNTSPANHSAGFRPRVLGFRTRGWNGPMGRGFLLGMYIILCDYVVIWDHKNFCVSYFAYYIITILIIMKYVRLD